MDTISQLELTRYRTSLRKFVEFSDDEWHLFSAHLYKQCFKKRAPFVTAEKVCSEVGFILDGSFRFYFVKDGLELSSYFCFENELISSYRSFLKRVPGGVTIEAMTDAALLCFSHASLQELLADERTAFVMERFGRSIAEYLICCYEERVFSFVTQTPEERYTHFLEQQPEWLQLIPQRYLANYLGVTPVSLSRIRKRIHAGRNKARMAS